MSTIPPNWYARLLVAASDLRNAEGYLRAARARQSAACADPGQRAAALRDAQYWERQVEARRAALAELRTEHAAAQGGPA